jgi:hypothetical protein
MNTFHHFLPECVAGFLDAQNIITFSSTNSSIRDKLEKQIQAHKQRRLEEIFRCFHRLKSFHLDWTIQDCSSKIKYVLLYLPELFSYIEKTGDDYIDLGYYKDISLFIPDKSELAKVTSQLLSCLKNNKKLKKCNLGLFEWQLERDTILEVFQSHPNLEWLSLRTSTSKTRFTDPPHTIYRNSSGEAVWSHFKPDN